MTRKLEVGDRVRHVSPEVLPRTPRRTLRGRVVSVFRNRDPLGGLGIWMIRVKRDGRTAIDTWAMGTWVRE